MSGIECELHEKKSKRTNKCLTLFFKRWKKMDFVGLDELFNLYPFIQSEMNWSKEDIRIIYESHLLKGKINTKNNDELLIERASFERLIQFQRDVAKDQKDFDQNSEKK
jgi:hypothetical protein